MTNPPVAFLAYLTQPAPGVCLLNLQADRESELQRFEIKLDDQLNMLMKLADLAGQHNRREKEEA